MKGRSRAFDVAATFGSRVSALSVGFNQGCDAVIATAVVAPDHVVTIEPAVIAFLNSSTVLRWAETSLGL
jgi:hypothetical protein